MRGISSFPSWPVLSGVDLVTLIVAPYTDKQSKASEIVRAVANMLAWIIQIRNALFLHRRSRYGRETMHQEECGPSEFTTREC